MLPSERLSKRTAEKERRFPTAIKSSRYFAFKISGSLEWLNSQRDFDCLADGGLLELRKRYRSSPGSEPPLGDVFLRTSESAHAAAVFPCCLCPGLHNPIGIAQMEKGEGLVTQIKKHRR